MGWELSLEGPRGVVAAEPAARDDDVPGHGGRGYPRRSARDQVFADRPGGEVARRAGDRAAGMRARSGEVQRLDSAVGAGARPVLEELPREHLAVEDVAARDPEARLELARAERDAVDDPVREARTDLGETGDREVGRLV